MAIGNNGLGEGLVGGQESASLSIDNAMSVADSPPTEYVDINQPQALETDEELIRTLVRRGNRSDGLRIKLSGHEAESLVTRIIRDFDDAEASLSQFKQNHLEYSKIWRGVVSPKDFPFEGAANIQVPLTSSFVEQMKARLLKALIGGEKVSEFSTLDNSLDQTALAELNDWFKWELEEVVGLKKALSDILHEVLIDGIGLPVPYYAHEEKTLVSLRDFEIQNGIDINNQLLGLIEEIFKDETPEIRSGSRGKYEVEYSTQEGSRRTSNVVFSISEGKLNAAISRQEVTFDGVRIERTDLENLVVVNSDTTIEGIPFFGSRMFISVHDYLVGVRGGKYIDLGKEATQHILAGATNKQGEFVQQLTTIESDKEEGTQSKDITGVDFSRKWLEVYRWEGRWTPGEKAIDSDPENPVIGSVEEIGVAVWVDSRSRRVIRIVRLEELNKDGKRSPVKFDYIVQPDRFFSVGLVEWLRHVQAEISGIHNQRLDAGLLTNVPFFFYTKAAGLENIVLKLSPGKGFPIKDINGVLFPKINWTPQWSFQEEATVRRYAQEQAGLGDAATGSFVSKRTSASEFLGTASAVDLRTEFILSGLLLALRELLYRIFGLYQQYAKDGRVFQVTGITGERIVKAFKRDRMHGKITLHLTGNVQQLDAQLERDVAVNMLSLMLNELLIQLGIVKPDTIYAALERILRANNYKGIPIYKPDIVMSQPPNVEHKRMMMGEPVQPSPMENFNEHLQAHLILANSPMLPQYLPTQESQQALAQHIQATVQMQQAVAMLRQQQALQAQGMRGNMEAMGIRPGLAGGSQPGDQSQAASREEGTQVAPSEAV